MRVTCPHCEELIYESGLQTLVPEVEDGKVYVIEGVCPIHGYVSGEAQVVEEASIRTPEITIGIFVIPF